MSQIQSINDASDASLNQFKLASRSWPAKKIYSVFGSHRKGYNSIQIKILLPHD